MKRFFIFITVLSMAGIVFTGGQAQQQMEQQTQVSQQGTQQQMENFKQSFSDCMMA